MFSMFEKIKKIQIKANDVLSINNRNLGYVYPNNNRTHFPLANDKLICKKNLSLVGVKIPRTYFSYGYFYELKQLEKDISELDDFVIKPANGSAGNGIVVITCRSENGWLSAGGRYYSLQDIRKHISDIIFGAYSHDMSDTAIIEQRIVQHEMLNDICDLGLSDIRIILYKDKPVTAMARVPSSESDGKANIHQGAIALGIDITSGITIHGIKDGESITEHPDSGKKVIDIQIPYWRETVDMAIKAAESVPLKYLGVDIAITDKAPIMIEINARPGIEIQNANNKPMRNDLETIGDIQNTGGKL